MLQPNNNSALLFSSKAAGRYSRLDMMFHGLRIGALLLATCLTACAAKSTDFPDLAQTRVAAQQQTSAPGLSETEILWRLIATQALDTARIHLAQATDSPAIHQVRIGLALASHQPDLAQTLLDQASKTDIDPHTHEALQGWIALQRGQSDQAVTHFRHALALDHHTLPRPFLTSGHAPQIFDADIGLISWALQQGETKIAGKELTKLENKYPQCAICAALSARLAWRENRGDAALSALKRGLELDCRHHHVNQAAAMILVDNRLSHNIASLARQYPQSLTLALLQARQALDASNPRAAKLPLRRYLAAHPGQADGLGEAERLRLLEISAANAGWTAHYQHEPQNALTLFDQAVARLNRQGNPSAELGRAWSLQALGRSLDARQAMIRARRLDPESRWVRAEIEKLAVRLSPDYRRGDTAMKLGNYRQAARLFQRAEDQLGQDLALLARSGRRLAEYKAGVPGRYTRLFENLTQADPLDWQAWHGLAEQAKHQHDAGRTALYLRRAFNANPWQDIQYYKHASQDLMTLNNPSAALDLAETGIRFHPQSASLKLLAAQALVQQARWDEAETRLSAAASLNARYVHEMIDQAELPLFLRREAYYLLGWSLYFSDAPTEALKRFNDHIRYGGTNRNTARGQGFVLVRLGRCNEALPKLTSSLPFEPSPLSPIRESLRCDDSPWVWPVTRSAKSLTGWCQIELGQYDDAVRIFQQILRQHPDWHDAWTGLGIAQQARNQLPSAKQAFKRALALIPGYPPALAGLTKLAELAELAESIDPPAAGPETQ